MDSRGRPVAVVTGATGRLGLRVSRALAARGADVVMVGPRDDVLADAADSVRATAPEAAVAAMVCDVSLLAAVGDLADAIAAAHPRVDALVHLAHRQSAPTPTVEGLPDVVAVNYLAAWLLTDRLLGALSAAPDARVVVFGSPTAAPAARVVLPEDLLGSWAPTRRSSPAASAELFTAWFARELVERRGASGVTAVRLHDPRAHGLFRAVADGLDRWGMTVDDVAAAAERVAGVALGTEEVPDDDEGVDAGPEAAPLRRRLWDVTDALVTGS